MAPPVARCSNGPTPRWRIFARVIGSSMFLRARVAFARAICVRRRLLARGPSLVSSGDLNGSLRRRARLCVGFLLHAARREMELAWPCRIIRTTA